MPLCPICGYRLKVADRRCDQCGTAVAGKAPAAGHDVPPQPPPSWPPTAALPKVLESDEPAPLLSPALSLLLRVVFTGVSGLGLFVAGYVWFHSESAAFFVAALVLVPVLMFFRGSAAVLFGVALVGVALGFTSCTANFRWAGG